MFTELASTRSLMLYVCSHRIIVTHCLHVLSSTNTEYSSKSSRIENSVLQAHVYLNRTALVDKTENRHALKTDM